MKIPPNEWPATDNAQGVLLFAQLFREMLAPETFESFRVFSLDTPTRLREAASVAADIKREEIPQASFKPFLEELLWSLKRDHVLKEICPEEVALLQKIAAGNNYDISAVVDAVSYLRKKLDGSYGERLEARILELLAAGRNNEFRAAVAYYCTHLVNRGYSKSYILMVVDKVFFSRDMRRVSEATIRSFMAKFRDGRKSFIVYTGVSDRLKDLLDKLGFLTLALREIPGYMLEMPQVGDFNWYMKFPVEHQDEYRAAELAEFVLKSIEAINYLGPQSVGYTWGNARYVVRPRAQSGLIVSHELFSCEVERPSAGGRASGRLRKSAERVLGQFEGSSSARLLNSIKTSSISKNSGSIESHLISLWSAVEVLVSDPPKDTPRIVHYVDKIVPCICTKYVRRVMVAVYENLLVSYRKKFLRIVQREAASGQTDLHSQFCALIMLPENDNLRQDLLQMCAGNPLARYRLYKIWSDFGTPKALKDAVIAHEKRIAWQIYRIYRARNQFVHAGRKPITLDALVTNLFEYYKTIVWTTVSHAQKESGKSKLDECVSEVGFQYTIYVDFLTQNARNDSFDAASAMRASASRTMA